MLQRFAELRARRPAKPVLVVGATGQLGTAFVRHAVETGLPVRALVRHGSRHEHLAIPGVELAFGDLRDQDSIERACDGVGAVIATATVICPTRPYNFEEDERLGYQHLASACAKQRVSQLLFVSATIPFHDEFLRRVPTVRMKQACEEIVRNSGVPYTILRCTPFMDNYFALIGSTIPLRFETAATLERTRGVSGLLRKLIGNTIDQFGVAHVPGPRTARHAFVAIADVAKSLLNAIGHPDAYDTTLDVTGPENLSWTDVCDIYADLLGRRVFVMETPAPFLKRLSRVLQALSPAFSNQVGLLWILSAIEMTVESTSPVNQLGVTLTHARHYLESKLNQSAESQPHSN
ncbi:MAG: SDR family oxidoreductase [Myxococcota bacterium]